METNAHYIKFSGKANIPSALKIGEAYKVYIDGEVTSETLSNNQNGTQDATYKFEPIVAEIHIEHGPTVKTKDVRANSQKIRKVLYAIWSQKQTDKPFDTLYNDVTSLIIQNAEAMVDKCL